MLLNDEPAVINFAALRMRASLDIETLASEFSVELEEAIAWEAGRVSVPPNVLQSLQVLAQFPSEEINPVTHEAEDDRKPGAGRRVLSFFTGCGGLDLGFEDLVAGDGGARRLDLPQRCPGLGRPTCGSPTGAR